MTNQELRQQRTLFRNALRELVETAAPFAKQEGTTQEKALWADIQWAKKLLGEFEEGR